MKSIKDIFLFERNMQSINIIDNEELFYLKDFKRFMNNKTNIQLSIKDDDSKHIKKLNVSITRESLINYYFFYNKFIDKTSFEKEIYALTDRFLYHENADNSAINLAAGNYSRIRLKNLFENDNEINDIIKSRGIDIEQNIKKEKTEIVKKLVNSKSPEEFSRNLFYYLYKKLIDNKSVIRNFDFNIVVEEVVSVFKDNLKKNQASFTVNFGQLFEEVFREKVFNILNQSNEFNIDLSHNSKKIAIVLLYCCNERFKSGSSKHSIVYNKIVNSNIPTDSDYIEDYKRLNFKNENILFDKVRSIIEKYRILLNIENNSVLYCNDAEKDEIFNAPSNSPFDFCVRHKDLKVNGDVGFFDLKAHNKFTQGSSCLVKGATGSNGGTLNSALTFINSMLNKAKEVNPNSNILFFGLIQITFELDFDSNNIHDIVIHEVGDRIAEAMSSAEYSVDKSDFYLSNDPLNKTSLSLLELDDTNNFTITKSISDLLTFTSIKATRQRSYRDVIKKALDIIYKDSDYEKIEDYFKFQDINQIRAYSQSLKILFDPDFFDEINTIYTESVDEEDNSFNRFRNDTFNCSMIFGLLYDRIFSINIPIQVKRTLSSILVEIFNGSNKIENFNECKKYLEASGCKFSLFEINADTSFASFVNNLELDDNKSRSKKISVIKQKLLDKVDNSYNKSFDKFRIHVLLKDPNTDRTELFYQQQASAYFESFVRKNKTLKEVFNYLYKKKANLIEGALGGHMMHPYEALDMTPDQLTNRIKQYGVPQKLIEKVDGQNLFFTVNVDGTLLFARNKEDMTHEDLVEKFTGHPAEKPFIEGGNAIKAGVESLLYKVDHDEIVRLFQPSEGVRTFVNFEIMHPNKPNQIVYDEKYIVFHGIVDYRNGREEVNRSNQDQRIQELVSLMSDGVSSAGFVLASNREVDLNNLTDVQISEYVSRIYEISSALGIESSETLGEGIINVIRSEINSVGVSLSDEVLSIFSDYVIKGEDNAGRSIASKDWTKFLSKEDVAKLRKLGLTSSEKVRSKIGQILQPFKGLFVELGIDLLKGVKSSYMSDETNSENILSIRNKLQTAITDLENYMSEVPKEEWPNSVKRLIPHVELIRRKGLENIVSSAVEGGVYNSNDNLLKVTGGFAPMNQIVGAAYRDRDNVFKTFKEKFMSQENNSKSLKSVFNLIF